MELKDLQKLKTRRDRLGGPELDTYCVRFKTITPILGGGTKNRNIDEVTPIRPPTIRGHLRQWYRALFGHTFPNTQALHEAEGRLFGAMNNAETDDGTQGASQIRLRVDIHKVSSIDSTDPNYRTPSFYAIWPAQSQRTNNTPAAPRYEAGIEFTLTLKCPVSTQHHANLSQDIKKVLIAWSLFGGYGSRARRGLGSLTLTDVEKNGEKQPLSDWMVQWDGHSTSTLYKELRKLLGEDTFKTEKQNAQDYPSLLGASLYVGNSARGAENVWVSSLNWLKGFRQSQTPPNKNDRQYPRERGQASNRPGRSNWPEADKVRRLSGNKRWAHTPKHNHHPVWPRAGFGLPILGQFKEERGGLPEPKDFELQWVNSADKLHTRLASPLIIKALPIGNDRFVPIALWLDRRYPKGGQVCLKDDRRRDGSYANFDELIATGDTAQFYPLDKGADTPSGTRLRTVFFYWIQEHHNAREVGE